MLVTPCEPNSISVTIIEIMGSRVNMHKSQTSWEEQVWKSQTSWEVLAGNFLTTVSCWIPKKNTEVRFGTGSSFISIEGNSWDLIIGNLVKRQVKNNKKCPSPNVNIMWMNYWKKQFIIGAELMIFSLVPINIKLLYKYILVVKK